VDLKGQTLSFGDTQVDFDIDPFAKHCLLNGVDELGYTLTRLNEIAAFERQYET
jgi:3-isopropylmalate dehydratase small subunit